MAYFASRVVHASLLSSPQGNVFGNRAILEGAFNQNSIQRSDTTMADSGHNLSIRQDGHLGI